MNCPKCGRPYDNDASICPVCKTPLGNAQYMPVPHNPQKRRNIFILFLFMMIFLAVAGYLGYHVYLRIVENECKKVTQQVMTCAQKMDFSSFDQKKLPDLLSENPDIKDTISQKIDEQIYEMGLTEPISNLDIDIDYDDLYDAILRHAQYSITDVHATYNKCTVTLTTSNINYIHVVENMKENLESIISGNSGSAGWWGTLTDLVTSWLNTGDSSEALPTTMSGWIEKLAGDETPETVTGKIVYGIKGGHWTLISIDENLFYNYYGFPIQ